MAADPSNLSAALSAVSQPWQPQTVARFNGNDVMVAKAKGSYAWHRHEDTDDFFLVLQGNLTIEMRDRSVHLGPGDLFVVPRGVEHRPVAAQEAHFLLIEPPDTATRGTTLTQDRSGIAPDQRPFLPGDGLGPR